MDRLIGSIRRECLDHIVILCEDHLRRVLEAYAAYYNHVRPHLALAKDAPGSSGPTVWPGRCKTYPRRTWISACCRTSQRCAPSGMS
jgi:hypothetical protein